MYKLLIELLKDITIEERINIIEMLYYEGGSSCILDMIRASFSIDQKEALDFIFIKNFDKIYMKGNKKIDY